MPRVFQNRCKRQGTNIIIIFYSKFFSPTLLTTDNRLMVCIFLLSCNVGKTDQQMYRIAESKSHVSIRNFIEIPRKFCFPQNSFEISIGIIDLDYRVTTTLITWHRGWEYNVIIVIAIGIFLLKTFLNFPVFFPSHNFFISFVFEFNQHILISRCFKKHAVQ